MPQVQSLAELTQLFETAAAGGTLVLTAALLPQAGEIAAFLAQAGTGVAITSAVVTPGTTTVTVTGKAVLFPDSTVQYAVTLTGRVPQTTPLLSMTGTPVQASGWTFASNFPPFPDYWGAQGPLVTKQASFFDSLALTRPSFQVSTYEDASRGIFLGVTFAGVLDSTQGALAVIQRYLPPGVSVAALPLSGPLDVRADAYPLVDLTAPIPGLTYVYPQVTLGPVELRLLSLPATEDEPDGTSLATLSARATFGQDTAIVIRMDAPVLQAQFVFTFGAKLPPGLVSLPNGLGALGPVLGGLDLPLPPGLDLLGSIYLAEASFGLSIQGAAVSLTFASITIGSDETWNLPLPGMAVKELRAGWTVGLAGTVSLLEATVTGTLAFGTPPDTTDIEIWTAYPEWAIGGNLRDGNVIPVGNAIAYLTGNVLDVGTLNIVTLDMEAYPWEQSFQMFTEAVGNFPLVVESVIFEYFNFTVLYTPNTLNASLLARISIAGRGFAAQAVSPRSDAQGWYFSGGLLPGQIFSLQDFANALLTPVGYDVTLPTSVAAITLTKLQAGIDTRTEDYFFIVRVEWTYAELGWPLAIAAELDIQRTKQPGGELAYSGFVQGEIQVNKLAVLVAYRFAPGSRTIFFQITYKRLVLSASLVTKDQPETRLLVVRFPDVSLGELVEWLVGLAAPQLNFKLGSPWDLLNQINFKNLSLTVDLIRNSVTVQYAVNASFLFVEITAVGLTYVREGGRGRVKLALSGRFLDTTYSIDDGNPLEWDVVSEPPPSVPAKGPELIDIRYLGLGQRVALQNVAELTSVSAALAALKEQMKPPKDPAKNPLTTSSLRFDPKSTFLFGLEATLLRTVTLGIVLNDPRLYGLVVKLGGERAGSMSGLEFELLYRRISDDVGVFNVVLALPEAFRHYELGAVSITLPIIRVDIYTNGNFKIDLGFPRNGSFKDSFSVQVFPFVGYGGIYFAALNGTTSTRVPKITSGTFDPVIELGVGLSVGVGKDFRLGPLSGGATLTLEVIFEGTFAWYTPTDKSSSKAVYYWVQGTAALVARIYGEVDFFVVKASVSVEARASATLVLEAYQPTQVTAQVSVTAKAKLRVIFVTVHFSFSVKAEVSFTIGRASTPPWTLAAPETQPGSNRLTTSALAFPAQPRLRHQRGLHRPLDVAALTARATFSTPAVALRGARRLSAQGHFVPPATLRHARTALFADGVGEGTTLNWEPVLVLDGQQPLPLTLLPALTVAPDGEGAAQTVAVLSLYVANTVAPHAYHAEDVRVLHTAHLRGVESAGEAPFNLLLQAVLLWSIDALLGRHTGTVTLADLEQLYADLQEPDAEEGLTYDTLTGFLAANFQVAITAPATGTDAASSIFPIIPDLALDGVLLTTNNQVGDAYRAWLNAYYAQMGVDYEAGKAQTSAGTPPTAKEGELPPESLATVVFRDYFLMLARTSVQAAIDVLATYQAVPTAQDSLQSIAGQFAPLPAEYVVHAGDTVASIAATFDMTVARLEELNGGDLHDPLTPGQVVNVEISVTPARVAEANPGAALAAGVALDSLSNVLYQVRSGDTLTSAGARFGVTAVEVMGLAINAGNRLLLQPATPDDPTLGNLAISQPGTGNDYASFAYTTVAGDTLSSIAVWAYVRNQGTIQGDPQDWYAQTIADFNPGAIPPGTDALGQPFPIPPGTDLLVPAALWSTDLAQALHYAARSGDTLPLVAGYYRVLQTDASALTGIEAGMQTLNPAVDWANLQPGTTILVPAQTHRVRAGESFAGLAALFGVPAVDLAGANASTAGFLAPLAVLAIPPISPATQAGDTFARVADRYNLTISELAADIATVTGVFQVDPAPAPLVVPGVPMYDIAALVARVVDEGLANQASAMVARYLLHALRVPSPEGTLPPPAAEAALEAFSIAIGQQVAITAVPQTIEVTTDAAWITLASDPLPVVVDQAMLDAYGPALTFDPEVLSRPDALPFRTETPVHYVLQAARHWQTAEAIPFAGEPAESGPVAGEPTLWDFPAPLLAAMTEAAAAGDTVTGGLFTGPRQGPSTEGPAVQRYDWAVSIDLQVRLIPSSTTPNALRNVYQVLGAVQDDRPRLLALWKYLSDPGTADAGCTLYLLYAPNAGSNNPAGVASVPLAAGKTVLLKTNLSTLTTSNPLTRDMRALAGAPVAEDLYAAPIEDAAGFLALLWEGSVTGTGGYTLSYAAADGAGLPDQLFATGATGSLTLVAILDAQSREVDPDRSLRIFNNCAVVGDNVDAASTSVFAEITVGNVQRTTTLAALQAGTLGFTLSRRDPTPGQDASAEDRTRSLYSLLGYRVEPTPGAFQASHQGQPVDPSGATQGGVDVWTYQQVISIYPLAESHPLPAVPGLPSSQSDPYAGVAANTSATLSFDFYDVFGNDLAPTQPVADLSVPVKYFDDVIGLSQWPGLSPSWRIAGTPESPALVVEIALQVRNYSPGAGAGWDATLRTASAHAARYQAVYYQLWQPDVTAWLTTSLNQTGITPAKLSVDPWMLGRFVSACLVHLGAARLQVPVMMTVAAGDTLASIAREIWPDDPDAFVAALGEANQAAPAASLFAGNLLVPDHVVVAYGDTLVMLAGTATTPEDLAVANESLPLFAGTVAAAPSRTLAAVAAGAKLLDVALAGRCTVAGIANANRAVRGMLAEGKVVTVDGASLTVTTVAGETQSFEDLVEAFLLQLVYTDPATIAAQNEALPGLLDAGATPAVTEYVIQSGDTFVTAADYAVSGDGSTDEKVRALATAAQAIPNLFLSGTSLGRGDLRSVAPDVEPLAYLAQVEGVEVKDIATASAETPLVVGASLILPDRYTLATPPTGHLIAPYSVRSGGSLDAIAATFGEPDPVALAARNEQVTYVFNPGQTIAIPGTSASTTTVAADSIDSVWARLKAQDPDVSFVQLIDVVAPSTTLLAAGAFIETLAATTGSTAGTLAALTDRFGIEVAAIAQANGSLDGLLVPGVDVTVQGETIEVRSHDTLESMVTRFETERGVTTSVAELAELNRAVAGLAAPSVTFLLPPKTLALSVPVSSTPGYGNAPALPGTIFPLETELVLARDSALVIGDGTGPAQQASGAIAPRATPGAATTELTLRDFAASLKAAFPTLEVALGRPTVGEESASAQQTWAVNFGTGGIESVSISGGSPSFFALKPLRTTLVDRAGVPVRAFDPETGKLTPADNPPLVDFQGIDLEVWAGNFLASVETLLSPAYAAPGYARNGQAFHDVVAAKKTLADAIAGGVDALLATSAPTGSRADAAERLRQELLVNLSRAYQVETIVQYPAASNSPFGSAQGYSVRDAPRLAGRPSVRTDVSRASDTLDTLAAKYKVTAYAVALVLAVAPDILRAGAPVSYAGTDYAVPAGSTLVSLTAYVGAPDLEALADDLLAPEGLFVAGAVLDLYGVSVQASHAGPVVVVGGPRLPATFERVASFFGTTLGDITRNNEIAPGVFVYGPLTVTIPGQEPVTVTVDETNDTIAQIAALVGTPSEVLVGSLAETAGVLADAFVFHLVSAVPNSSFSAAKTSLFDGISTVNVLFDVPAASRAESAVLDLHYEVDELEYDVATVPGTGGYQASAWLSFILPVDPSRLGGDLGQVEIPIPLRAYPPTPTLLAQTAAISVEPPPTVAAAKAWAYQTSYQHLTAAQDEVFVTAEFNLPVPDDLFMARAVSVDPLFDALAQFVAVQPALSTAMARLLDADGGASYDAMAETLSTFATLVGDVAAGWSYAAPPRVRSFVGEEQTVECAFATRSLVGQDGTGMYTLRLVDGTPSPTGSTFPDVAWRVDSTSEWVGMERISTSRTESVYRYVDAPVGTSLQHRLSFPGLDVVQVQNGISRSHVTRNAQLVAAAPTASGFVFQTGEVTFTTLLIPLVEHDVPVSINQGTSSLADSLQALFTALLGPPETATSYTVAVAAQYGYELLAGPTGMVDSIISRLPILLYPAAAYTASFPQALAAQLQQWQSDQGFSASTGLFVLDVTVFTSLASRQIPILALGELVFDNAQVGG